jgi:hypothetical protein
MHMSRTTISLVKVKANCGIYENEMADANAREGALQSTPYITTDVDIPTRFHLRTNQLLITHITQLSWQATQLDMTIAQGLP